MEISKKTLAEVFKYLIQRFPDASLEDTITLCEEEGLILFEDEHHNIRIGRQASDIEQKFYQLNDGFTKVIDVMPLSTLAKTLHTNLNLKDDIGMDIDLNYIAYDFAYRAIRKDEE